MIPTPEPIFTFIPDCINTPTPLPTFTYPPDKSATVPEIKTAWPEMLVITPIPEPMLTWEPD